VAEYVGYRTKKRLEKKKNKGKAWKWLVVLGVLILVFVVLGAFVKVYPFDKAWNKTANGFGWLGHQIKSVFVSTKKVAAADFLPEGKKTANYLIGVTKQINGSTFLSTCIVASYSSVDKSGSLIYFPYDVMVNAPGMGTDQLSNLVALDQGRISSTLVTVENILGTEIDRYVLGTDRDLRMILTQFGEKLPVNVTSKLSYKDPSLNVTVNLKPGRQDLTPSTLASYLTYGTDGGAVDLAKRQEAFAPELIGLIGATDVKKFVARNANLFDTDASDKELTGMLQAYASLGDKVQTGIIPVKEFRFEKSVVNRPDQAAMPAFVKKYLKSDSTLKSDSRVKIEVLNGCGVPGVGEKVSSSIDLSKYQIVNSGNADNFDHAETVIVVYSADKTIAAAAQELRNELQVGKIESHPQGQDTAQISVIVGKDFASK